MQRFSKTLCNTLKETPNDAVIASHQLMLRAGLIQKSGSGLYNLLPLGLRVIQKVERIIREELNRVGCLEVAMTVVTPSELWKESKRWDELGDLMLKFTDRSGRECCVSPTNEEAVVDLFRAQVKSYKSLPLTLYQINTKFRDEIRPRFGLMRCREFIMKDAYSFHETKSCLDETYESILTAYQKIFNRIGLDFMVVEADAGAMADSSMKTHEFQVIADSGEDEIVLSRKANYSANIEKAATKRKSLSFDFDAQELQAVETPNKSTIQAVSEFLNKPKHHTLKSLIYKTVYEDKTEFIQLLLLGDDELNELKLKSVLSCSACVPATDEELISLNLCKGYIGPQSENIRTLCDVEVNKDAYYVVGANKKNYHCLGFQPKKLSGIETYSLRLSKADDVLEDGSEIEIKRGIEVGHIFQLGDKYSRSMSASILNSEGKNCFPLMGCYGIGVGRTAAAAIEQSHDEKGIIWPVEIAPYQVDIILGPKADESVEKAAEKLGEECEGNGFDVIVDDRSVGMGFKFKDYELIGFPCAVVLGKKWQEQGVLELKIRKTGETLECQPSELVATLKSIML